MRTEINLAAALKETLAALKATLTALELNFEMTHPDYDAEDVHPNSIIGRARAAILRAEGRAV